MTLIHSTISSQFFFLFFLIISIESRTLSSQLKTRQSIPIYEQCTVPGSFSLTFDDGFGQYSSELTQLLNQDQIKTTFFLNGNNAACIYDYEDEIKKRYQAGHLLASHGWSHAHMASLSREQVIQEIAKVEDAFIKLLGVKPRFFRPPYGEYDDQLLEVLSERGYKGLVMWSKDSGDSLSPSPSSEAIISSYQGYGSQEIVLNHEIVAQTVREVMPRVIRNLKNKGYSLRTVGGCLGVPRDSWYTVVGQPGSRDETWTCS